MYKFFFNAETVNLQQIYFSENYLHHNYAQKVIQKWYQLLRCWQWWYDEITWCVSLFTIVSLQVPMNVIRDRLVKDKTLQAYTFFCRDITSLLKFIVLVTFFPFEGEFSEQVHNAQLGSPSLSGGSGGEHIHGERNLVHHVHRSSMDQKGEKRWVDRTLEQHGHH